MSQIKLKRMAVLLLGGVLSFSLLSCGKQTKETEDMNNTVSEIVESESELESAVAPEDFLSRYEQLLQEGNGESNITYYQNIMDGTNAMAAIIYLGSMHEYHNPWEYICAMDLDIDYGFVKDIPESHMVDAEGSEVFLLIPRDMETTLAIYKWEISEENNYQGEKGQLLYEKMDGNPVLVKGNLSEIMPNFCVNLVDKKETEITYAPFISGEDGKLHPDEEASADNQKLYIPMLWDATWYEVIMHVNQNFTHDIENELVSWDFYFSGSTINYDDELVMYELSLIEGGEARFSYNYGEYEGTWSIVTADLLGSKAIDAAEHVIELHLTCGYQDDERAREEISGLYAVDFWTQDEGFYLIPLDGDYLISDIQENTDGIGMSFHKVTD